jgi:cystathionine beta-lyase/cystathionine gamma-synthase
MKSITKILHTRIDNNGTEPIVTPLYQCSAFSGDSPYFYSRKDNPNISELEKVIGSLEKSKYSIAVSCGMAAIYLVLDLLKNKDILVLNKHVYGCTYRLLQDMSKRRGFILKIIDLSEESDWENIPENTKMVLFETPTNPFLKTVKIYELSHYIKRLNPESLVVVDNTWATPLFQRPLEYGADISLHSGTKYFSGHSDVMSGILVTNRDDLHNDLRQIRFYGGMVLSPGSAWLTRRSMQTFNIRMLHHQKVTLDMFEFLKDVPQVLKVYYPEVDGIQLKGYGGIIFFELRDDLVNKYDEFTRNLKLFGTGTGMACVTSMVAQPYTGSHASMTPEEKREMGLDKNLVRLCFGLEDPDDLKDDLNFAFKSIDS